jgi:hypothetical protein
MSTLVAIEPRLAHLTANAIKSRLALTISHSITSPPSRACCFGITRQFAVLGKRAWWALKAIRSGTLAIALTVHTRTITRAPALSAAILLVIARHRALVAIEPQLAHLTANAVEAFLAYAFSRLLAPSPTAAAGVGVALVLTLSPDIPLLAHVARLAGMPLLARA